MMLEYDKLTYLKMIEKNMKIITQNEIKYHWIQFIRFTLFFHSMMIVLMTEVDQYIYVSQYVNKQL